MPSRCKRYFSSPYHSDLWPTAPDIHLHLVLTDCVEFPYTFIACTFPPCMLHAHWFITVILTGEGYRLSTRYTDFLDSLISSFLLSPYILLCSLFADILSLALPLMWEKWCGKTRFWNKWQNSFFNLIYFWILFEYNFDFLLYHPSVSTMPHVQFRYWGRNIQTAYLQSVPRAQENTDSLR